MSSIREDIQEEIRAAQLQANKSVEILSDIVKLIQEEIQDEIQALKVKTNHSITHEEFQSFKLHTNITSDAIRSEIDRLNLTNEIHEVQNEIKTSKTNLTESFQLKLDILNTSLVVLLTSSESK